MTAQDPNSRLKELDKRIALYQEAIVSLRALSAYMQRVLHSKHPDPLLGQAIDAYDGKLLGLTSKRIAVSSRVPRTKVHLLTDANNQQRKSMTTSLLDYLPFAWLPGATVQTLVPGFLPRVLTKPMAKTRLLVALSSTRIESLEVQDRIYTPPEFYLSISLDARCNQYQVAAAWARAEVKLIQDLFPIALPRDLVISHRGGWDTQGDPVEMGMNAHTILLSVVHVQP